MKDDMSEICSKLSREYPEYDIAIVAIPREAFKSDLDLDMDVLDKKHPLLGFTDNVSVSRAHAILKLGIQGVMSAMVKSRNITYHGRDSST